MTQPRFKKGDVIWVGALGCGYTATVLSDTTSWGHMTPGAMVRTADGKEFYCPDYAMRPLDLLGILAAQ